MTLDKAIEIYEKGTKLTWNGKPTVEAEECQQMMKWLKDYKRLLEQKPCEDAISRQDLREPRFIIAENDYQKGWNDALESVYENAPNIQPQPKMGQWEWNQYDSNPNIGNWHCSECHCIGRSYFDYCPACGAKMSEIPTRAESEE